MKSIRCLCVLLCASLSTAGWCATADAAEPAQSPAGSQAATSVVSIPGPLRSFLRMAGISQKVAPDEVLPLLARNVVVQGYHGWQNDSQPTEFLILLNRYVQQARELAALAGPGGVIRISTCEQAAPLLTILGYRFHEACGKDVSVETADADRAFLTLDSGFPLVAMEQALASGNSFSYPYTATPVPVLFSQADWMETGKTLYGKKDVLDVLLRDPAMARLYWALSRLDSDTRNSLRQAPGLRALLPYTAVLDFCGGQISIRSGTVVVPGGAAAASAWKNLVGAAPEAPADFITRLLARDKGWLAAYFDALSRVSPAQQAYLTEPGRLARFYQALRGKDDAPGPARPAFRDDPGLVLLVSRLRLGADGQPIVPGNLDAWKDVMRLKSNSSAVRDWGRQAAHWNSSDQLVEAMFGVSRYAGESGPLQAYLTEGEIDRRRSPEQRLTPQTVRLLAEKFSRFGNQYTIFSEFSDLDNASIARFLAVAQSLDRINNANLRSNALGIFQANVGLWEILARQGEIPAARTNDSWQQVVKPFAGINSSAQLFDAGRASLVALLQAASDRQGLSQEEILALLAGPRQSSPEGQTMRHEMAERMRSVLEDQRLVSLDTLLALGDGLNELEQGKPVADRLLPLAKELREFEFPRPLFTSSERSEWAPTISSTRHAALQTRTDLTKVIMSTGPSKGLTEAKGYLAELLRDTLVGLNYAYYEPPGAQMLHNNPLFVRSHDFAGSTTMSNTQSWQTPQLFGSGLTAGRGAHLVGSLADLPYVLSQVEQDFIVPENVQALIWQEAVPVLVTSAILPRWWKVDRTEMHAAALYQRAGEELLAAAAHDPQLRQSVVGILSDRVLSRRAARIEKALAAGNLDALPEMMPGEMFYLAAEFRHRSPGQAAEAGAASRELDALVRQYPAETSWERLSQDFGVPHPALAQSYARELLNVKPFPALMGYGSRLLAESWDSCNLYWARLADEQDYSPVLLNRLVPQLTRRMVEKIFATDFEDLPALSRAMHEAGDEFVRNRNAAPVSVPTSQR